MIVIDSFLRNKWIASLILNFYAFNREAMI